MWQELWAWRDCGRLLTNPRHSQSIKTGTIKLTNCAECTMQDQETCRDGLPLRARGRGPFLLTASTYCG